MRRLLPMLPLALAVAACDSQEEPLPLVGTLERDRIELIADASERIVEISVVEGEAVAEGQLLLRLDPEYRQAQLDVAVAQRTAAGERLNELVRGPRAERIREARARVAGARQTLTIRANELERVARLVEQRLASDSELDSARNAHDVADADFRARSAMLDELLDGTTREELAQAEARVAEAGARVELAMIELARLELRAPRAGIIDVLPYELGERPPAGATLVVMLAGDAPYARIYVPEPLRARVVPELAAVVVADGVAGELAARVRYVAADPVFTPYFALTQRDRSRLAYLAEVVLTDPAAAGLPVGLPVEVDFPGLR